MPTPAPTPIWTSAGAESLRDLYQALARDRPKTARRTIEAILDRVEALAADPERGRPYRYAWGRPIQVLSYGPFEIAYLIDDAGGAVVLGIFHGLVFLPPP